MNTGVSDSDAQSHEWKSTSSGSDAQSQNGKSSEASTSQSGQTSSVTGVKCTKCGSGTVLTVVERLAKIEKDLLDIEAEVKDEDKGALSYKQIATLWRIQQSPLHKLALEEWQRKEHDLHERATQRALRSQDLHTQLHNIIGWYAVFQGVVLTAVSQLSEPAQGPRKLCGKAWFPVVLTGLGTFVTIVAVWRLFLDLQKLEKTINSEKKTKQEAVSRYSKLIREGVKDFSFKTHTKNNHEYPDPAFKWEWGFVIVSLLLFSGVFILSYFVILCDTWMATKWN